MAADGERDVYGGSHYLADVVLEDRLVAVDVGSASSPTTPPGYGRSDVVPSARRNGMVRQNSEHAAAQTQIWNNCGILDAVFLRVAVAAVDLKRPVYLPCCAAPRPKSPRNGAGAPSLSLATLKIERPSLNFQGKLGS